MNGKILLDRKILDWEWWSDVNTTRVFIYLLLKANWKDTKWKGQDIKRGSLVTSLASISSGTNLTIDEVRTCIKHLLSTGEITKQITNRNTIIFVVNYDLYQQLSQANPTEIPSHSQAIPKPFPTDEEYNNTRKKENVYSDSENLFEQLWQLYPKKKGKGSVSKKQKRELAKIGYDKLAKAIKKYSAEVEGKDQQYTMYGSTFFNSGYVDYLEEEKPAPVPQPKEEEEQELTDEEFMALPTYEFNFEDE